MKEAAVIKFGKKAPSKEMIKPQELLVNRRRAHGEAAVQKAGGS
jgi:hypothetical protein